MSAGGMPVSINLNTIDANGPQAQRQPLRRKPPLRPRAHGMRNVIIAGVGLLLAGAVAVVVLFFAGRSGISAQGTAAPPTAVAQGQQPAGPVRTETITYDMWTVACRDTPEGGTRKACSAKLTIQAQQQNQRITVGNWIIGRNTEGGLVSVVQTPQLDVGILITSGVEIKLGDGKPRKINFIACNPRLCESSMPMDDATIKETIAAANGAATISFRKGDGAAVTINLGSIKGIDKAIAAVL
jgi:invasion protein IalB